MKQLFVAVILASGLLACSPTTKQATGENTSKDKKAINLCGPVSDGLATEPGYDGTLAPLFEGLDVYHYPVSTKSKKAQKYFDQGLLLAYGFNHAEAARSFREAIRQDPECAMCYWGLAYVLGPNYNAPMDMEVLGVAQDAVASAKLNLHKANAKEKAIIMALNQRYPKSAEEDPMPYYERYATAIGKVAKQYPEDSDVAAMAGEALMNLHPWELWTLDTKEPYEWTQPILDILEAGLAKDAHHPQLTHLYVHAMEQAPDPERAMYAADNLRLRVPGSGHLLHMPSHLYINTGDYRKGSIANELAVKKDSQYVAACHMAGIYPLVYYPHNWHFLAACAGLEGNGTRALEASRYMADYVVAEEMLRVEGLETLQHFASIPWFIMIKFNMWGAMLAEPEPAEDLPYMRGIWHYGRGMAYASTGQLAKAAEEMSALRNLNDDAMAEFKIFINNGGDILNVAEYMLAGQMAMKNQDYNGAVTMFAKSVEYEDKLKYIEPPDWFFSVRHYLGDAMIKNGQYADAEAVYRKDLKRYKNNGWALHGLAIALEKQYKKDEAAKVREQHEEVWQHADVELHTSVL